MLSPRAVPCFTPRRDTAERGRTSRTAPTTTAREGLCRAPLSHFRLYVSLYFRSFGKLGEYTRTRIVRWSSWSESVFTRPPSLAVKDCTIEPSDTWYVRS